MNYCSVCVYDFECMRRVGQSEPCERFVHIVDAAIQLLRSDKIPALMPPDIPRLEPMTSTEAERIDTNERVLKHLKQKFNRR